MPSYTFENTETSEIFEEQMSNAQREEFLEENPHIKQIFLKFPGVVDPGRLGLRKPDANFRDVLKNVKSHHKKNNINDW